MNGPKRATGDTRAMILGLYLQGRSQVDIARLVGISRQAVNQHLSRMVRDGVLSHPGRDAR